MAFDSNIIDEDVFNETFIPEKIVCREGQVREIARCVAPARSGRIIRNLFVYGPPGVGKTIVCRSVLNETCPKHFAYVNCWNKRTGHKIWEEILLQMGFIVHGKESASELEKKFEKSGKRFIVIMDEADLMKDWKILYSLARNRCGIILISNTRSFLSNLDPRIASSLLIADLEFRAYSTEEVFEILKERAKSGVKPGALSESLLKIISVMAGGDARIGLQILRIAARDAESKGLESITLEEVKSAAKCARKYKLSYLLSKLDSHERTLYNLLKEAKVMGSGRLYSEYCKSVKNPVGNRAYRKHLKKMENDFKLFRGIGSGRWRKYEIVG